jgi:hypothetical protein
MILVRPRNQNNGEGVVLSGSRSLLILMGAQFWRETVGDEPLLQKSDFYHGQTEVGEVGDDPPPPKNVGRLIYEYVDRLRYIR